MPAKTKYDPKVTPLLVKWMCRSGLTDEEIAKELGIHTATLYRWKAKYPELEEAMQQGKEFVDHLVEDALLKRALGYEYEEVTYEKGVEVKRIKKQVAPDTTAQIFWLKNRQPDKWRDKQQHEHTGADGGPIQTESVVKYEQLSEEEIDRLIQEKLAALGEN